MSKPLSPAASPTDAPVQTEHWRIGTLAARVGLSETLLRAWELRYGLLSPARSASGYRLYGPEDERRIHAMIAARERGVPASRAAAEVLAAERAVLVDADEAHGRAVHDRVVHGARDDLVTAMRAFDDGAMHEVIDRVLRSVSVETAIRDVLLPFMHDVGVGWSTGEYTIADEHFATEVVRARLAALTIGGAPRTGPIVLMACPPGEGHDLALKAFEVILQRSGWRTRFLGAQTPTRALLAAAVVLDPDLVVIAATRRSAFRVDDDALRELRTRWPLAVGGSGADAALAERWGAIHLPGDPVTGARRLVSQRLPHPSTAAGDRVGPPPRADRPG